MKGRCASVQTIDHPFVEQSSLPVGRWLQRVRAPHAIERTAAGDSVTKAGLAVGYDSTGAFIALFKRVLGETPRSSRRDRSRVVEAKS